MAGAFFEGLIPGLMTCALILCLRRGRLGWAIVFWVAIGVVARDSVPFARPRCAGEGDVRVAFLDAGQGDAALVQTCTAALVIDAGGGRPGPGVGRAVERALIALGAPWIDALAVTHGDFDHRGGAARLIERGRVDSLWLPDRAHADATMVALANLADRHGVAVRWLGEGDRLMLGGRIDVEVLWPPRRPRVGDPPGSRNDASLVLRIVAGGLSSLWMADVSTAVEDALIDRRTHLRADLLKVGHHGSARSSGRRFLAAVRPQLAVLSAPCLATRGLPAPEIHARLASAARAVAWTGRDGAVRVQRRKEDGRLVWRGFAPERPCLPEPAEAAN